MRHKSSPMEEQKVNTNSKQEVVNPEFLMDHFGFALDAKFATKYSPDQIVVVMKHKESRLMTRRKKNCLFVRTHVPKSGEKCYHL